MKKGFTLIEITITIVILGVLAVIAVAKYQDMASDGKKKAALQVLDGIKAAVAVQYSKNLSTNTTTYNDSYYPQNITGDMFADGQVPINPLNNSRGVANINGSIGTPVSNFQYKCNSEYGWWYYSPQDNHGYSPEFIGLCGAFAANNDPDADDYIEGGA